MFRVYTVQLNILVQMIRKQHKYKQKFLCSFWFSLYVSKKKFPLADCPILHFSVWRASLNMYHSI